MTSEEQQRETDSGPDPATLFICLVLQLFLKEREKFPWGIKTEIPKLPPFRMLDKT